MSAGGWRVLPLATGAPVDLLTEGMALFDGLERLPQPTLRWYRSDAPAIVLGRGQGRLAAADGAAAVTTRFSGGGAVWLAPDVLCVDVLIPAGHPWVSDRLAEVFDGVGAAWLAGLEALGIDGLAVHDGPSTARRRGTPRERLLAAVCYATLGRGEVLWHGRKLVGLAQRRRRHGVMVQCGLLRTWDPRHLLRSLGATPDDAEILHAAVGLDEIGDDPPDDDAVIREVTAALTAVERGADRSEGGADRPERADQP